MANKQKEYDRGRNDGFNFALKYAQKYGVDGLEDQARIRGIIGLPVPYTKEEMDEMAIATKVVMSSSIRVGILSVLHDAFGFGEKRLRRFNESYDKLFDYLSHGWIAWMDLIEELKKTVNIDIEDCEWFHGGLSYNRPDDKDIYSPDDFISPADWSQLMQDLGYTDYTDSTNPLKHWIRSADGSQLLWEYEGQAGQVRLYDFLDGIRYAMQNWGLADE